MIGVLTGSSSMKSAEKAMFKKQIQLYLKRKILVDQHLNNIFRFCLRIARERNFENYFCRKFIASYSDLVITSIILTDLDLD